MKFTKGSVLNMTPARGTVTFGAHRESRWTEPLIGFAVVVKWVRVDGDDEVDDCIGAGDVKTSLTPVVVTRDGDGPFTLDDYLEDQTRIFETEVRLLSVDVDGCEAAPLFELS